MKDSFEIGKVIIVVPACIRLRGKNRYLNLNDYTNWHYRLRNDIKKQFTLECYEEIKRLPKMKMIHSIRYTLVRTSNRKRDRMNVYSIVDKFFCDALQHYGIIEDDSDEFINDFVFTKTDYIKGKQNDIRVQIEIIFENI